MDVPPSNSHIQETILFNDDEHGLNGSPIHLDAEGTYVNSLPTDLSLVCCQ